MYIFNLMSIWLRPRRRASTYLQVLLLVHTLNALVGQGVHLQSLGVEWHFHCHKLTKDFLEWEKTRISNTEYFNMDQTLSQFNWTTSALWQQTKHRISPDSPQNQLISFYISQEILRRAVWLSTVAAHMLAILQQALHYCYFCFSPPLTLFMCMLGCMCMLGHVGMVTKSKQIYEI